MTEYVLDGSEHIDITQPVREICQRFGLDPSYVAQIDLTPTEARVVLFRGRDGRCLGTKYIDQTTGEAATETLTYEVRA